MHIRATLLSIACAICAIANAQSEVVATIDIPAGDLRHALLALSEQLHLQLVYEPEQLQPFRTTGLKGRYSALAAVRTLLRGTPLALRTDPSGAMIIAARNANSAAQSATAAAMHVPSEPGAQLEEVVVTAQKRAENLQKVPLAVTAVTGGELRRAGVVDAQGLTDLVPGLEVGNLGSTTIFTIRGVTTNTDPNLGDTPTAFHVDGIYQGRPAAASGLFYDIDRIEVLSGPQGTLYGKDSTGGTINIVTRQPSFDGPSAVFSGDVGNYGLRDTAGVVNAPLSKELALRFAFQSEHHSGYLASGYSDANDLAGRIHLLWHADARLSVLFTQDYFHAGGVGNGQTPVPRPGDYWASNPWSAADSVLQALGEAGYHGHSNDISNQTSLQLDWNFDTAKLTSVSAYHHLHLDAISFLNGTPSRQLETDAEITQELRLSSAEGSQSTWVLGAYYHRERQTNDLYFFNEAAPGTDSDQFFPDIDTPSYALFGQLTYPLSSTVRATLGMRGNNDQKIVHGSIQQVSYAVLQAMPLRVDRTTALSVQPQASPSGALAARRFTWRAGLDADLGDDSLLFVNMATGYKQGGLDAAPTPHNLYRPETIMAYELGNRNRFVHDRLQLNIDAYWYDYRDYQVDQLEYFRGEDGSQIFGDFVTNAADARHVGLELQSAALITRHDLLTLNVAYQDAVFTRFDFPQPPASASAPGTAIADENLSGYAAFNAPRWAGTLMFQHTWPLQHAADLVLSAQLHAESEYWLSPDHQPDSRQASYTRTQLLLRYSTQGERFSAAAFVRNLENSAVYNNYTFQGPPPAHNYATLDPPRTFGLSLQISL